MWVVVALTILSLGFYLPVWFGQTWSELKRVVRDPGMNPVWHAMSLVVPIYSWFRTAAHFRTINELGGRSGLPSGIGPRAAVVGILVGNILSAVFVGVLIVAAILAGGQRSLNRIWEREFSPASQRKASAGEWVAIVVLPILLVGAFIAVASNPIYANQLRYQVGNCRGWQEVHAAMGPIKADENAFWADLDGTLNPDQDDSRRWATKARSIRQQFEASVPPPALDRYVKLSAQTYRNYELGFGAIADGDSERGQGFLDRGDEMLPQIDAALTAANAECVS